MALFEDTVTDAPRGRIANGTFGDHLIPVNADVPDMDVVSVDDPDRGSAIGAEGIGEVGLMGIAAAVANASTTRPGGASGHFPSRSTLCCDVSPGAGPLWTVNTNFGRFFTRHTGTSHGDFRRTHLGHRDLPDRGFPAWLRLGEPPTAVRTAPADR